MFNSPGFKLKSLLSALQALAAPGAVFARPGSVKNAYLDIGTVKSDTTGFPIRLTGAEIIFLSVTNDNNTASFEFEVYEFDGVTETLLTTLVVTSSRSADFVPPVPIAITFGSELRGKINNVGTANNPVAIAFTTGEVPT